jgi:hypothetical protein
MTDIVEEFMKCAAAAKYNDWKLTQWSDEYVIETYVEICKEDNPAVYELVKLNAEYSHVDWKSLWDYEDQCEIDVDTDYIRIEVHVGIAEDMTLVQMRKYIEKFLLAIAMGWKKLKPKAQITLKAHPIY